MLSEVGRVVAIEDRAVWVETLRQSTCGKCAARSGCGHGMLNTALPGGSRGLIKTHLPRDPDLEINLHDTVEISLPERSFLSAAAVLYLVPLLLTVIGAALVDGFLVPAGLTQGMADLRVCTGAGLGLAAGLLLLRGYSQSRTEDPGFEPSITARVAVASANFARGDAGSPAGPIS